MASNVCILRLCAFSLATLYLKNSSSASFPGVNFAPHGVPLQSSSQPCVSQMIVLEIDLITIVASQFLVLQPLRLMLVASQSLILRILVM